GKDSVTFIANASQVAVALGEVSAVPPGVVLTTQGGLGDAEGEGTSDVEARERSKLLDGDLVSEGGLDSERAYEDVSEHGAIGQRLDGVGIGGEGAAQVGVLLQLSEQELDEPPQPIRLDHLGSREHVARDGREIPTDLFRGVSVTDEAQPDRLVALAPNDVEV